MVTQRKHPDHISLYGLSTRDTAPVAVSHLLCSMLLYVPFFRALLLGPGAFLPRPEDRRQPPFLDQLYASNGGCSMSICHRLGAGAAVQWGRGGEAGWSAAPPGRLVAHAEDATLLEGHARARARASIVLSLLGSRRPREALHIGFNRRRGVVIASRVRGHCGTPGASRLGSGPRTAHSLSTAQLPNFCRPKRAITAARLT